MDWDMKESAFAVDWLKFNSTNSVDLTLTCPLRVRKQ
jgi:hypothetical protein